MIASADGPLPSKDGPARWAAQPDKALFATLRSLAAVVLMSAGTMRAAGYGPTLRRRPDTAPRSGLPPVPPIEVIPRSFRVDWGARFFSEAEQRPLVVPSHPRPPRIERGPPWRRRRCLS
jgi:riboflavin biosynthesis pyrimidine reductase